MIHLCDICNKPLIKSGNHSIYFCAVKKEWVSQLRRNLDYYHCLNSYDKDEKALSKLITVPPYIFEIDYIGKQTKIKKIVLFREKTLKNVVVSISDNNIEEEVYCELPTILELPWNDIQKVEEKLKIYNLFY